MLGAYAKRRISPRPRRIAHVRQVNAFIEIAFEKLNTSSTHSHVSLPVHIIINFPMPMEIQSIELEPSVGRQRIVGVELRATSAHRPDVATLCGRFSWSSSSSRGRTVFGHSESSSTTRKRLINREFICRFPADVLSTIAPAIAPPDESFAVFHSRPLASCRSITLTLTRTELRTVPCLGRLRIFGQPSTEVRRFDALTFLERFSPTNNNKSSEKMRKTIQSVEKPPKRFIDPLTERVMSDPVVLPSGQILDRSSLDRMGGGECSRNPFTATPLAAADVRPQAALKSEIDTWRLTGQVARAGIDDDSDDDDELDVEVLALMRPKSGSSPTKRSATTASRQSRPRKSRRHHHEIIEIDDSTPPPPPSSQADGSGDPIDEPRPPATCSLCSVTSTTSVVYRLDACRHFLCRDCLMKATPFGAPHFACPSCACESGVGQITRSHFC